MKISEVIAILQKIQAEHGDRTVYIDWGSDVAELEVINDSVDDYFGDDAIVIQMY
jgi:hypothetical protein